MFGDSLTLNELRKTYPELYRFMRQSESNSDEPDHTIPTNGDHAWPETNKPPSEPEFAPGSDVAQLFAASDSTTSLLTIRKAMSSIFECLNAVHVQKTSKLRLEIRDLCCRLQSLQVCPPPLSASLSNF